MINTKLTRKAMIIAYNAHQNQFDKANIPYIYLPYIYHPIHIAEQMDTELECIVALLHDVVEDTDITLNDLEKEFPQEVIDLLKILTHDKKIDYIEYIKKVKTNPIATKIKIADLKHNSDITRLENITTTDLKRIEKYKKALEILGK